MLIRYLNAFHSRDGIMVISYDELLTFSEKGINYLDEPLILTDSPIKHWSLFENLYNLFDNWNVKVKTQVLNCSCFSGNDEICHEMAQTFLYTGMEGNYAKWAKYEGTHKKSHKYLTNSQCVNAVPEEEHGFMPYIRDIIDINDMNVNYINYNKSLTSDYYNNTDDIYTKLYTYFRIYQPGFEYPEMEFILNLFDSLSLSPYFKMFNINGYYDIDDINLWFGTEYYRAIRHYDKADNLFMTIAGSRLFRLSKPTNNVFNMHPYAHPSGRQQFPNYPILEASDTKEGTKIPDDYKIHDVAIYENEVLYLPGYWLHEVINHNFSFAMTTWWASNDQMMWDGMENEFQLPVNPHRDDIIIPLNEMNEFFYFFQFLTEEWCLVVNNDDNDFGKKKDGFHLRCNDVIYPGYGFIFTNFVNIYPILNGLTYDTFDWYSILLDIDNILKSSTDRIKWGELNEFKEYLYYCYPLENEDYYEAWKESAFVLIEDYLLNHTNFGSAESDLQEFIEYIILELTRDTNILPIIITLLKL